MAISITHPFVSAKGDGTDATLVRPSNWNAAHTTSMATGKLIGRATAGAGVFEELPTSAYIIAALAATDVQSFLAALGIGAFETGDVKFSMTGSPGVLNGWLTYNGEGTIGNAGSGATLYANAAASNLYQAIWNNIGDPICAVTGGRGASAAADFAALKPIAVPRFSGRTIVGLGTGSGLTARNVMGQFLGEENHTLTVAELPTNITSAGTATSISVSPPAGNSVPYALTGSVVNNPGAPTAGGGNSPFTSAGSGALWSPAAALTGSGNASVTSNNTSGGAHNNMQPFITLWVKVRL
jgi:hypothetical protein